MTRHHHHHHHHHHHRGSRVVVDIGIEKEGEGRKEEEEKKRKTGLEGEEEEIARRSEGREKRERKMESLSLPSSPSSPSPPPSHGLFQPLFFPLPSYYAIVGLTAEQLWASSFLRGFNHLASERRTQRPRRLSRNPAETVPNVARRLVPPPP